MEIELFIDDLPIKIVIFHSKLFVYQRLTIHYNWGETYLTAKTGHALIGEGLRGIVTGPWRGWFYDV